MSIALNLPVNGVSFGQVSLGLLREFYKRETPIKLQPLKSQFDLSTEDLTPEFEEWLANATRDFELTHSRKNNIFKLWHLAEGISALSEKQILYSFYELDTPTQTEVNIVRNNHKVLFSSSQAVESFRRLGCENVHHVPLAFDDHNFKKLDKKYFTDDRIVFSVVGKFEQRKNHGEILKAWASKFGNDRKYALHGAVWNPFFSADQNNGILSNLFEGKKYWNINFSPFMEKNSQYNEFLNSSNIVLAMSGGEGWGLPEFHSVGVGKHAVVLNCSGYKDWANEKNSVLIQPNGKRPAFDGAFFKEGEPYNQGSVYTFDVDEFISGCEEAIKRVEQNRINEEGLKLQEEFPYSRTVDSVLAHME